MYAKKRTTVYVPSQWHTVISLSRKQAKYTVAPLRFDEVKNFKEFVSSSCPNMKIGTEHEKVNWLNLKWIQVRRGNPRSIFINYGFKEKLFIEVNVQVCGKTRTKRKKFPWMDVVPNLYDDKLPISSAKKKDLLSLCRHNIIPEEYHSYYESLPKSASKRDTLPAPSAEEIEDAEYDTDLEGTPR